MGTRFWICLALLLSSGTLAVATAREFALGNRAMADADAALARGDLRAAILSAHAAAESLAPFSSYPARARKKLESLASLAEAKGDQTSAILAWRAMRSAALATRAIGLFNTEALAQANEDIARIEAKGSVRNQENIRRMLDELPGPTPIAYLIRAIGLVVIASLILNWLMPPTDQQTR